MGAYSFYFGMLQRLFTPARKYLFLSLSSLIFMLIPIYMFQAISSAIVSFMLIWSIIDVRKYGGSFPMNYLVLISPLLSTISWILHNYYYLIPPLLSYVLGVNIGVFTANIGSRAVFGIKQIPILVGVIFSYINYIAIPITIVVYTLMILVGKELRFSLTSVLSLTSLIIVPISSIILGDIIHSFMLGVMTPMLFTCSIYSTSRYNYNKALVIPILDMMSYYLRFLTPLSGIPWLVSFIYYIALFRDNLSIVTVKTGMSKRYLM